MKYQLWYSGPGHAGWLLAEDDKTSPKAPDARLIWAVDANTYDEARQKRDEFLERAGFELALPQTTSETSTDEESPLRTSAGMPFEPSREGVVHIIYTAHGTDADFQRIEADLNRVAKECPHLVLVVEDVLATERFRERLDPSLRSLPPDVLFGSSTTKRNREELAKAYASAINDIDRAYRAWNAAPVSRKREVAGGLKPFHRRLFAWAADNGLETVREETSLEAWLTHSAWDAAALRANTAAANGDEATMWAESRKGFEILARATQLRNTDTNAQIARLLQVERRGHDVLYIVGAGHSSSEELLVRGLEAIVHDKRILGSVIVGFLEALVRNHFDDQPAAIRERIETISFLHERLHMLARPTTSVDDVAQIVDKIDREAAARNLTLRQIVDHMITVPDFQNAARTLDGGKLHWLIAMAFILDMINGGFILLAEVEKYLELSPGTS